MTPPNELKKLLDEICGDAYLCGIGDLDPADACESIQTNVHKLRAAIEELEKLQAATVISLNAAGAASDEACRKMEEAEREREELKRRLETALRKLEDENKCE